MDKKPVIGVVGPTAVGKSDVAVDICLRYGGEVVSADSMQIYRGMDIGTAKLTQAEQCGVPHHLLDLVEPTCAFTVAAWKKAADAVIEDIHTRAKLPVICGGTGLYVRAITDDLTFSEQAQDDSLRKRWQAFAEEHGPQALHAELARRDAVTAARLHPHDIKRVIRALEVAEIGQAPLSAGYDWSPKAGRYDVLLVGLWMERAALYRRVEERVDMMVAKGLFAEVERLLQQGVGKDSTALQAIGYKEIVRYFDGESTADAAIEAIKRNTRRFVKRQLSWFRRDPRIHWFERAGDGSFVAGEKDKLWGKIGEFIEGKSGSAHE